MGVFYLLEISKPDPHLETVLHGKVALVAADEESLACGACKGVLAQNVSRRTLFDQFCSENGRLIIQCECGAYNVASVRQVSPSVS